MIRRLFPLVAVGIVSSLCTVGVMTAMGQSGAVVPGAAPEKSKDPPGLGLMKWHESLAEAAERDAGNRSPVAVGVPEDGWVFVISPAGTARIVLKTGRSYPVIDVARAFGHIPGETPGDQPTERQFNFRTGMYQVYMDDYIKCGKAMEEKSKSDAAESAK